MFCALRGERFDGHNYCRAAVDNGAPMVMVDRPESATDLTGCGVLVVDDTVLALGKLAARYRQTLDGCVIAITGSVGKTTTKHLIGSVLSGHMTGTMSPKSFNNHIGVPLTLLAAEPTDRFVICEVGTSGPGEIEKLGRIIEPDVAVITQVGAAHLEGLGSIEGVLDEKASLLKTLRPGGLSVLNGDVPGLAERAPGPVCSFGERDGVDLRLSGYEPTPGGSRIEVNGRTRYGLGLLGRHNALNALAAMAVAEHLGLDDPTIDRGLGDPQTPQMRLSIELLGDEPGLNLINDAYNANPLSMAAALSVLSQCASAGHRIAVLGDMAELGSDSDPLHRELGRKAAAAGIDRLIFIGPESQAAAEAARRAEHPSVQWYRQWSDSLGAELANLCNPGDTVLIKASRSSALERLVPHLKQRASSWSQPST